MPGLAPRGWLPAANAEVLAGLLARAMSVSGADELAAVAAQVTEWRRDATVVHVVRPVAAS